MDDTSTEFEDLSTTLAEATRAGDAIPGTGDGDSGSDGAVERPAETPRSVVAKIKAGARHGAAVEGVLRAHDRVKHAARQGDTLGDVINTRTVRIEPELDEDAFFTDSDGHTTITNRYDLEQAVPVEKKQHFREIERYWVNKPYAFIILFESLRENEIKYYVVEPHQSRVEATIREYLTDKLRNEIKYSTRTGGVSTREEKLDVLTEKTLALLDRYDLYTPSETPTAQHGAGSAPRKNGTGNNGGGEIGSGERAGSGNGGGDAFTPGTGDSNGYVSGAVQKLDGVVTRIQRAFEDVVSDSDNDLYTPKADPDVQPEHGVDGIEAVPTRGAEVGRDVTLTEHEVEKLMYYLYREFIGYEEIDAVKRDVNIEDISCNGYNEPVFAYHTEYEQLITNIEHGSAEELDDFVVKLAQRSGKGISKREPEVDATLPDGSRAQLTLGEEVSDRGSNYTIRQFKEVPFTPVDLINWNTFDLDQTAMLWLAIENGKSLLFAGGTASGKTTSLNAMSLFIPSKSKIVSIEDTREVELPQRNWVASVTRESFDAEGTGDVDEFDLLESSLRRRPDYILMGEVRGEEGRTLFQVMSTGHTTYTTFHADTVGEVIKRFTTDPINVSKTMFTSLDLVSVQTSTRVNGQKVRRNKNITEVNYYDADDDQINVQKVFEWKPEDDSHIKYTGSKTMDEIREEQGWSEEQLRSEIRKREIVLSYLIKHGLNTYTEVAATLQAYMKNPDMVMHHIANNTLEDVLNELKGMESVLVDIPDAKEELVPRPTPTSTVSEKVEAILQQSIESPLENTGENGDADENTQRRVLDGYTDDDVTGMKEALNTFVETESGGDGR